jgi:hypothetical protein
MSITMTPKFKLTSVGLQCSLHCFLHVVRKYRPQNDHVERSDLAKRFFIARWERERARESKERGGERGRVLNTPQWDSA